MARKQSTADRQARLDSGACPVHGIGLGQIDGWFEEPDWRKRRTYGQHYTLTHDGRKDCPVIVKSYSAEGPWELPREWQHLLLGESEGDLEPRGEPEEHLPVTEWFRSGELAAIDMPLPYSVFIEWSEREGAYLASLPEWADRVEQPVARGATYSEAAHEAMFAIYSLLQEANVNGQEPPRPHASSV